MGRVLIAQNYVMSVTTKTILVSFGRAKRPIGARFRFGRVTPVGAVPPVRSAFIFMRSF